MPINFDLEFYRNKFNCINYFETGLYDCNYEVSAKIALKCNFKNVFSVEIRDDFVNLGKEILKNEIDIGRFNLIKDDSCNISKYLQNEIFLEKTMFFLDAHVDNNDIKNYKYKCPLIEELNAISNLNRKDNIILIDDIRAFKDPNPWGETSYNFENFLDEIKKIIININSEYKFLLLDGVIKEDVLMCYI